MHFDAIKTRIRPRVRRHAGYVRHPAHFCGSATPTQTAYSLLPSVVCMTLGFSQLNSEPNVLYKLDFMNTSTSIFMYITSVSP